MKKKRKRNTKKNFSTLMKEKPKIKSKRPAGVEEFLCKRINDRNLNIKLGRKTTIYIYKDGHTNAVRRKPLLREFIL